jgi:ribosomal protein S18 acetylase RimI-like enzyme
MIKSLTIERCNLRETKHQDWLFELLNNYSSGAMGQNKEISLTLKDKLIDGLQKCSNAFIFFAIKNNQAIGLVVAFQNFSTFQAKQLMNIHDLIVFEGYRNQGVARELLKVIERVAIENDCCRLTLEVREDNLVAKELYEKIGFTESEPKMLFWSKNIQT